MALSQEDRVNEDAEYPLSPPTPLDDMTEAEAKEKLAYLYSEEFLDKLFD